MKTYETILMKLPSDKYKFVGKVPEWAIRTYKNKSGQTVRGSKIWETKEDAENERRKNMVETLGQGKCGDMASS